MGDIDIALLEVPVYEWQTHTYKPICSTRAEADAILSNEGPAECRG